ncbi:uncharacterized protein PHACADRAFT_264577 [Phanerochaete carnosa HHB-10118-sp]|uniref:RRM domain-containing protein n=1 Tax=Phanerochaete carnosa (strain HHB-10118-sp) TaxID=650164 RepID=K5UKC6_PHACS|nr:uncharacterized protein PHACADRAFT_264577 [Phanerochaete carnosa HHB-10118-sp]EKM50066.1 hypothetical protein PHACADRAFT_264577 [Phanerochaete carnosa HHB-10118-sp]
MAEEFITKRLHVSGLTPAITPADLSQKLGSFGTVKALDGFGVLDVLGRPRPFGYVTLETTKLKLARCMNLLSGVTWKGTKLRIGEARPDFRERLAKEREAQDGEPPRKRRRLLRGVQGMHAAEMSLVTPENVAQRRGWKVTPLGRLVRPIRMRPERPLPEPVATAVAAKGKGKDKMGKEKTKKRKTKEPLTRARRQTIDPLKYGSQQMKGVFLESLVVEPRRGVQEEPLRRLDERVEGNGEVHEEGSESAESGKEEDSEMQVEQEPPPATVQPKAPPPKEKPQPSPPSSALAAAAVHVAPATATNSPTSSTLGGPNLMQEKNTALVLLQSLFGDDDKNWGGEESLSDVDMDELAERGKEEFKDDTEVVPIVTGAKKRTAPTSDVEEEEREEEEESGEEAEEPSSAQKAPVPLPVPPTITQAVKPTKLKDLFAPREEEAVFSLLGHLDLDDELGEDLDPAFTQQAVPSVYAVESTQSVSPPSTASAQTRFTLDPAAPLFFPIPENERANFRGRVKDPLDVALEKGWDWRKFCRTQSAEEIKQQWEEQKVELTKDWKRRHREAIKSRRRRGGAGDGE